MKKILITGGSGFLGRNLIEQLTGKYVVVAPTSTELNLLDELAVKNFLIKHQFNEVIHCAGRSVSNNANKDAGRELYDNLRMFFNLTSCNALFGRMFNISSGAVYGKQNPLVVVNEEYFGSKLPKDDYGFAKYCMAKTIQSESNIYDLRLFACFGKYEDRNVRFISNACSRAIAGEVITIRQNVLFDYLYINDFVHIMREVIEVKSLRHNSYNICSGKAVDLISLAQIVKEVSKKDIPIQVLTEGLGNEYSGSNKRLLTEIGQMTFTPLPVAIGELYKYYISSIAPSSPPAF